MIQCEFAKSDMTPCVRRDGDVCWAMDSKDRPICVSCERSSAVLGVPAPSNWQEIVDAYYTKHPWLRRRT